MLSCIVEKHVIPNSVGNRESLKAQVMGEQREE